MDLIFSIDAWLSLLTLTFLEIILGIDNIILISILSLKLEEKYRFKARTIGLSIAMITRVLLLLSLSFIMRLTKPIIFNFSGRDIILFCGGVFLIYKSIFEIYALFTKDHRDDVKTPKQEEGATAVKYPKFHVILIQIVLLDIVFSLDSVITAIGLAERLAVMVLAIVIAIIFMMFSSGVIANFVERHINIKVLALTFLLLVGFMLVLDAFGHPIPKPYIYSAIGFSLVVEIITILIKKGDAKPIP